MTDAATLAAPTYTADPTTERPATHGGIVIETLIRCADLPAGKVLKVSTLKRYSGVSTCAQVLAVQPVARIPGLYTESFTSSDPGGALVRLPAATRATAKALRTCHAEGLAKVPDFLARAVAYYKANPEAAAVSSW